MNNLLNPGFQFGRSPGVQRASVGMFLQQALELLQIPIQSGTRQRRSEMIDDDCRGAAFGLRPFPRVVYNKGIKMRHRPEAKSGIIGRTEPHCFTGKPFEISVLSKMHDGIRPEDSPNPSVKSSVDGRGREIGVGGFVATAACSDGQWTRRRASVRAGCLSVTKRKVVGRLQGERRGEGAAAAEEGRWPEAAAGARGARCGGGRWGSVVAVIECRSPRRSLGL